MRYLAALLVLFTTTAVAAPLRPINDGSSNTLLLAERVGSYSGQGGPGASAEFGEPDCAGAPARNTVWYRYVAPVKGRFVVVIKDEQGLRADLRLPGNPPGTVPIQTIADGTSNAIFPDEEKLSTDLDRGQTAYLRVDAAQPFDFEWRFVEAVNDFYQDAIFCAGPSGTIKTVDTGATWSAYEQGLGVSKPGTWFLWTAASSGVYLFDLVGSRQLYTGSYADFSVKAFQATNGAPGAPLGFASGNTTNNSTVVALSAVGGQSYYFLVSGPTNPADNAIWFSWYPDGSAGVATWAQSQWRGSEATGFAPTVIVRLRGGKGTIGAFSVGNSAAGFFLGDGVRSLNYSEPIMQDTLVEPEESYDLVLVGNPVEDATSRVFVSSDDADGACGFPLRTMRVREGDVAYLPVSRLAPGNTQVVGKWRVVSGTGTPGADWATGSGEFNVPSDGTSNTIIFRTTQDGEFEGDEYVSINLSPTLGSIADGSSNTLLIIEDDDYFVPRGGKYCGVIDTDGYGALVKFTLGDAGSATGTVEYQGSKYSFKGSFDGDGQFIASLPRAGRVPLGLRLKFGAGWDVCAASVRDPEGTWADGSVRRLPYDGKQAIAPQAGVYTVICEGQNGPDVPAAFTGVVKGDGSVRFIGKTADGTAVTMGGGVGYGGEFAFATALYNKGGNFYGNFDLGLGPQQPGGETTQRWLKPWRPKDAIYPALPLQQCLSTVRPFLPPAKGERVTGGFQASLGDGSVRFLGGGTIADGTSNTILISEQNKVTFPAGNPLKCSVTINPKTGLFTGKLTIDGGKTTACYGVFVQGAGLDYGYGFYLGDAKAGTVRIIAIP